MPPHSRPLVCLLLALAAIVLIPRWVRACAAGPGCVMTWNSPNEAFADADVVFRGRVLEYSEPEPPDWTHEWLHGSFGDLVLVSAEFEVEESWKGVETRRIKVYSYDTSCGVGMRGLEPGREMLVFAREHRRYGAKALWVNTCHRPISINHPWAQDARDYLGPGKRPLSYGWRYWLARIGPFVLPLLALPLGWWWRSRRRPAVRTSE